MVRCEGVASNPARLSVLNFVSHSLETGKPGFEAMKGKNEAQKVLLVHEDVVSAQKNSPYQNPRELLASFPGPVPIFWTGPGLGRKLVYSFILSQEA